MREFIGRSAGVTLAMAILAGGSTGQNLPAEPSAEPTTTDTTMIEGEPTTIFRAPLLREGSHLIEAKATIERDPARGTWKMVVDRPETDLPKRDLTLLPCTRLSEMQRIVEASPGREIQFQVTGEVFVFRGRNYVLPVHAPVLAQQTPTAAASRPAVPVQGGGATSPSRESEAAETKPAATSGDSAADIMRDLEKAAGPLVKSAAAMRSTEPLGDSSMAGSGVTMPEETSIVNRRGKIVRDQFGGWMFVFDADASGLADPPMRLLPCLLLERIEDYARRQGNNSPALMSGTVYLFNGRNYLRPTVFRVPNERRNITP